MRGKHCPACEGCTRTTCRSKQHFLCSEHLPRPGEAIGIMAENEFDITCLPCGTDDLSLEEYQVKDFLKKHRYCKRDDPEDK